MTIVAALLTILGYSINDTVVIYDRIRENLRRYKKMPLGDLLDLSVNETMSRTIMTVGTVFMALLALYFFGGEVIRGFTFAMLFGVLVGTYSSVFIAAPFLILIGVKRIGAAWKKAGSLLRPPQAQGAPPVAAPNPSRSEGLVPAADAVAKPIAAETKPVPAAAPVRPSTPSARTPPRRGKGQARPGGGRSKRRG